MGGLTPRGGNALLEHVRALERRFRDRVLGRLALVQRSDPASLEVLDVGDLLRQRHVRFLEGV